MPSDIDPKSGMRLPLPKREDLDEAGQKAYDRGTTPGATIAGLQGPSGIQLYSPKTAANAAALNRYLRFEAGFTPHVREVAILITAREMDSQFEWVAHEGRSAQGRRAAEHHRRHQVSAQHRRRRRDRCADHRARPPALARPQGEIGNLRQAETIFGPNKLVELVMLMGNYAGTAALLAAVDMQLHAGKKPLLPIP